MVKIAYWLLLLFGSTSCILFTFVGGTAPLAGYAVAGGYVHALKVTDSLAQLNGNLRRIRDGTGYDAGQRRKLYLPDHDVTFSVQFVGDSSNGRGGKVHRLYLEFVQAGATPFNGGAKRTPAENAQLAAALRTVETAFVEPLRRALR